MMAGTTMLDEEVDMLAVVVVLKLQQRDQSEKNYELDKLESVIGAQSNGDFLIDTRGNVDEIIDVELFEEAAKLFASIGGVGASFVKGNSSVKRQRIDDRCCDANGVQENNVKAFGVAIDHNFGEALTKIKTVKMERDKMREDLTDDSEEKEKKLKELLESSSNEWKVRFDKLNAVNFEVDR
ncbi:hypothetical protein FRX31_021766 [Thalictrum thalictroides]|uniref:Uncharacterized protein n=1 Tax=Thalictrum thalictroides TaxID=46969 RepID=A0A7J6VWS6_THATH|nr:hypothetical protein FRX31_021766 [Thalictrum thalictroides]